MLVLSISIYTVSFALPICFVQLWRPNGPAVSIGFCLPQQLCGQIAKLCPKIYISRCYYPPSLGKYDHMSVARGVSYSHVKGKSIISLSVKNFLLHQNMVHPSTLLCSHFVHRPGILLLITNFLPFSLFHLSKGTA